jgi:signal peptidase
MTSLNITKGRHTDQPNRVDSSRLERSVSWPMTFLRRLLMLVIVLVLGTAIAVAYGTVDNRWYKVVAVEGSSMEPTIDAGDIIFIGRPTSPEVGDIGVFQVNGKVVTHRIVDFGPDGSFVTRGDANPANDRWEGAEVDLIGVYMFRIPWVGNLFSAGIGAWFTDSDRASTQVSAGTYD